MWLNHVIEQLCITPGCSFVYGSLLLSWPSLLCSIGSGLAGLHFHILGVMWSCITEMLEQCCILCCTVGWVLQSLGEVTAQSVRGPQRRGILLKANVPFLCKKWRMPMGFCICKLFGEVLVYHVVFLIKLCSERLLQSYMSNSGVLLCLDFCEYNHLGCIKA